MDKPTQIDLFSDAIHRQISYFKGEFGLSVEEMVGVIEIAKTDLINSVDIYFEDDIEEEDDDSDNKV